MQSMQTVRSWRVPGPEPLEIPDPPRDAAMVATPERERDGRREIARLRDEIERIVRGSSERETARDAVDSALESVTRMQVATANIDSCRPAPATFMGSALVALADARLRGHADAIERGMTYTSDNQMQLLRGER